MRPFKILSIVALTLLVAISTSSSKAAECDSYMVPSSNGTYMVPNSRKQSEMRREPKFGLAFYAIRLTEAEKKIRDENVKTLINTKDLKNAIFQVAKTQLINSRRLCKHSRDQMLRSLSVEL